MFDESDIDPLRLVYGKLFHSHYCCSILVNSILMLLRMTEKPEKGNLLKHYPMIWKDYPDAHSSETMYDHYVSNTVDLLGTLEKPDFYSEIDPPIAPVQQLASELNLQSQPNIITFAVLLLKNRDDDLSTTVHDIIDLWKLSPHSEE